MKMHVVVAAALICVASVVSAETQRPGGPRGRAAAGEPDALGPAQILNMLDAWAVVQAQDTLQLADDQYGEFVARLKRLQQTRRRNLQARNSILQELRRLAGPQAVQVDDNAIGQQLKALADHDQRAAAEMRQAYDQLDQVLSPRQRARFRLFEEVLERRKIDLLKRAQQGAAARQRRQ